MSKNPFCDERRRRILSLYTLGITKPFDILDTLEKTDLLKGLSGVDCNTGELEHPTYGRQARLKAIRKDIRAVRNELYDNPLITEEDQGVALGRYRKQLSNLLTQTLKRGDIHHSLEIIQKLAMSHGVKTKEPITIRHEGEVTHVHDIKSLIQLYSNDNRFKAELEEIDN